MTLESESGVQEQQTKAQSPHFLTYKCQPLHYINSHISIQGFNQK